MPKKYPDSVLFMGGNWNSSALTTSRGSVQSVWGTSTRPTSSTTSMFAPTSTRRSLNLSRLRVPTFTFKDNNCTSKHWRTSRSKSGMKCLKWSRKAFKLLRKRVIGFSIRSTRENSRDSRGRWNYFRLSLIARSIISASVLSQPQNRYAEQWRMRSIWKSWLKRKRLKVTNKKYNSWVSRLSPRKSTLHSSFRRSGVLWTWPVFPRSGKEPSLLRGVLNCLPRRTELLYLCLTRSKSSCMISNTSPPKPLIYKTWNIPLATSVQSCSHSSMARSIFVVASNARSYLSLMRGMVLWLKDKRCSVEGQTMPLWRSLSTESSWLSEAGMGKSQWIRLKDIMWQATCGDSCLDWQKSATRCLHVAWATQWYMPLEAAVPLTMEAASSPLKELTLQRLSPPLVIGNWSSCLATTAVQREANWEVCNTVRTRSCCLGDSWI